MTENTYWHLLKIERLWRKSNSENLLSWSSIPLMSCLLHFFEMSAHFCNNVNLVKNASPMLLLQMDYLWVKSKQFQIWLYDKIKMLERKCLKVPSSSNRLKISFMWCSIRKCRVNKLMSSNVPITCFAVRDGISILVPKKSQDLMSLQANESCTVHDWQLQNMFYGT